MPRVQAGEVRGATGADRDAEGGVNQYARPYGHATRAEYWWMWLFIQLLALIPLAVMFAAMLPECGRCAGVAHRRHHRLRSAVRPSSSASVTLQVRRLHDAGFSGWLVLLNLAP